MRWVVVVGLLALSIAVAGVAAANEQPMAEAGLDRAGTVNSTVYLDAGGSLDTDGEIVDYAWEIERPNGTTTVPNCPSCSLTHFVPMRAGQYNATITVTDDDGATMADTMYVDVEGRFVPSSSNSGDGSGGSWSGVRSFVGGNSDSVSYNYHSGNLWIDLASGDDNVILVGAHRDPSQYGADFNAWMTDEEFEELVLTPYAERCENRIKITGAPADSLHQTLDHSQTLEHQHKDAETYTSANKTVADILDTDLPDYEDDDNDSSDRSYSAGSKNGGYTHYTQQSKGVDHSPDDRHNEAEPDGDNQKEDLNDNHQYTSKPPTSTSSDVYMPEGCTMSTYCPN